MICGTIVPQRRRRTEAGKERRRGKRRERGDVEGEIMSLSPCIPPPAHNAYFPPFSQQIRFSSGNQPPLQLEKMREKWESEGKGGRWGGGGGCHWGVSGPNLHSDLFLIQSHWWILMKDLIKSHFTICLCIKAWNHIHITPTAYTNPMK